MFIPLDNYITDSLPALIKVDSKFCFDFFTLLAVVFNYIIPAFFTLWKHFYREKPTYVQLTVQALKKLYLFPPDAFLYLYIRRVLNSTFVIVG